MAMRNCLAVALLACAASPAAQNYPNQPIRLIVPWPPGGGTPGDFERFVASELRRYADVVKASGAKVE